MLRSKSKENAPGVIDSRSNLLPSLAGAQVLRDVLGRVSPPVAPPRYQQVRFLQTPVTPSGKSF